MTVREVRLWLRYYREKEEDRIKNPGPMEYYLMQVTLYLDLIRRMFVKDSGASPKVGDYRLKYSEPAEQTKPKTKEEIEASIKKRASWSKAIWALRLGLNKTPPGNP